MVEQPTSKNNNKQLNWTTEMKMNVVIMDKEERAKGSDFTKGVKERWNQKYPEYQQANWQKLRDNAAWFKKDSEPMSLILVWQREKQPQDYEQQQEEEEQIDFARVIVNQVNNEEEPTGNNIEEAEQIELPRQELTEEDQDLKAMFIILLLENLTH